MKKMLFILIATVIFLSLFGCNSSKNELFTDSFFDGVVEIRSYEYGQFSGEQMETVIASLKDLELNKTKERLSDVDENGDKLIGCLYITFVKADGTEINLLYNGVKINGPDDYAYAFPDADENNSLGTYIEEAFGKAENKLKK